MLRVAIITSLVVYCGFIFSQTTYSRDFIARKKNVPLAILNNNTNYFFLLRYNKAAHDITIERRAKPSAEILSFTPLKLDSLNANWFDYEKLDYLFFEYQKHTYFLFERVLNSKKTIYLKIIDTLGKASGFIELATLEKEKNVTDINFEFKRTQENKILIIASQSYSHFAIKKTAVVYNIEKRNFTWVKKLPVENDYTGYSMSFETNDYNDLYYVLVKAHIASYQRKYINRAQVNVPVFFYDSLTVVGILNDRKMPVKEPLAVNNLSGLNSVKLVPVEKEVTAIAHFSKQDVESINTYFLNQKFSKDLSKQFYATQVLLDNSIKESLTFYDGSDYNAPSDKEYKHVTQFEQNNIDYQLSERVDEYYFKELLTWKNNLQNGEITNQKIIPRKIYSFQGRTRYKNTAKAMSFIYNNKLCFVVLETPANFKKDPNAFNYHQFKKETNLWRSSLVLYTLNDNGFLEKKLIYRNANFDAVPLKYQSAGQNNLVLYLNNGNVEKFATLKLD